KEMLELNGIQRFSPFPFPPCVYFLIRGGEIIYIGQTTNLIKRIKNHSENSEKRGFEDVYYVPMERDSLSVFESLYIAKFRPLLNGGAINGPYLRKMVESRMNDPEWNTDVEPVDRLLMKERTYRANIAARCDALYAERRARKKSG